MLSREIGGCAPTRATNAGCRWLGATLVAVLASAVPGAARAEESEGMHHDEHRNHVALFVGAGVETKRDGHEDEIGFAVGLEYERRIGDQWGLGVVLEALGHDTIREVTFVAPVSFHPGGEWRVFAGPGVETNDEHEKALFRIGAGYEIELTERWSLSPEIVADYVDGGTVIVLGGFAIGLGF